jgi:hypothetical protein
VELAHNELITTNNIPSNASAQNQSDVKMELMNAPAQTAMTKRGK